MRMADIAQRNKIKYDIYKTGYDEIPKAEEITRILNENHDITHVSMVHSETTSGILNDIASVSKAVKEAGRIMIVDAMSSFGGVDIPVGDLGIDFIISSANKCIQGVPGFAFIICKNRSLKIAKETPEVYPLTFTTSGKQWKLTENGDLRHQLTLFWLSQRPLRN